MSDLAHEFRTEQLLFWRSRELAFFTFLFPIIFLLLLVNSGSAVESAIVLLAVPFSLVGAFWLVAALGYNLSVAVWVGIIALAGLDAETGIVMLLYLDLAWRERAPSTRASAPRGTCAPPGAATSTRSRSGSVDRKSRA